MNMKKYLQVTFIWIFIIVLLAILSVGFRDYVLNDFGKLVLPVSEIILSICIFAVAWILIPKIHDCEMRDYIIFGVIWFALTNLFDLCMFIKDGKGVMELLRTYNFLSGNLWIVVVMTTLHAPIVTVKIKKLT